MDVEELKAAVMNAQLQKDSCKILLSKEKDADGNPHLGVKSIEVKVYGKTSGDSDEAVIDAVSMLEQAVDRLNDEGYKVEK